MTKMKLNTTFGALALTGIGVATIGAFGAGVYEGQTGLDALGMERVGSRCAVLGYVSQAVGARVLYRSNALNERDSETLAIMPIVPVLSLLCYSLGYAIGRKYQ